MIVLVTGGGGFLGTAICRMLRERGEEVRSLSRAQYPHLEAEGVVQIQGDLSEPKAVAGAVKGCEAVFHVGAKAKMWGSYASYHAVNVRGTRNVLDACRQHEVPRLVHTSTPSVTFRGRDEEGVDESVPYARDFLCHYARTKAEAEQMVLAANSPSLATVALRPHLIWGPGDTNLVPRVIQRARVGKLRLVGDGGKLVDSTYIENAALAHLCALDALGPDAACAGRAYFISNGEPLPMRTLLNEILNAAGLPPVSRSISPGMANAAGALMEAAYGLLRRKDEPMMTRFVARQLSTAHWYDITAAREQLAYTPRVTISEGMRRLAEHLAITE